MSTRLANRHFAASMRLLRRVGERCARLPSLGELQTLSELTARARIVRSALNARALFEDLQKNVSGLSAALSAYEQRRQSMKQRNDGSAAPPLTACSPPPRPPR
jgi:hypothetical protein